MGPFLLGLLGWTALLLWGWVQVGRSLGGPVQAKETGERQSAAEPSPGGVGQRDSDDATMTVHHD